MATIIWLILLLGGLYLLLIRTNAKRAAKLHKLFDGFIAHRGLFNATYPENSLPAFQNAMDNVYPIELDVQCSSDGELFVFHDDDLFRMTGRSGHIHLMHSRTIKEIELQDTHFTVPTLSEVLALVGGKVPLIIELKQAGNIRRTCEQLDKVMREYKGEYVIESFHPYALWWYRCHCPSVLRGQLSGSYRGSHLPFPLAFALRHYLFNLFTRPDFLAHDYRDSSNLSLRLCRKIYHPFLVCYTLKSQEDYQEIREIYHAYIFDSFIPSDYSKN